MPTSVINLSEPFFLKVLSLINQPASDPDQLPKLQRDLSADLQAIEHKVATGAAGISPGEWQSLKKVLIYWADEVLTAHIPVWENYVLEQEYFGEKNRAWKFYVEAEQTIPTSSPATAELFYLATVLGFNGDIEGAFKYELSQELPGGKNDPAEARRHWAAQLQRNLRQDAGSDLQGEPLEGNVDPISGGGTLKVAFAAFLITLLALLVVFGWWMLNR